MATYRKRKNGWRAEVRMRGHYFSDTFSTKAQAVEWATLKEAEIVEGRAQKVVIDKYARDAFKRYAEDVSPTKRGYRWEIIRLTSLRKDPLGKIKLHELTTRHLAEFRDRRLKTVSASTVNRELTLISTVLSKARKEWEWMQSTPMRDLDRPKMPPARDRLISKDEIDRLIIALGYRDNAPVRMKMQLVGLFFLLAIETGMRLGEMCTMSKASVHLSKRYIQLDRTKNGDSRKVPLSLRAVELCEQFLETDQWVSSAVASALFRKAVKACEIENLHFHDTRHEAITRLSKKVDVLALARIVGHRDLKSLMVYYNETATELAAMLG
jgi:integrase